VGDPQSRRTPNHSNTPGIRGITKECPTMSFAKNRAARQIARDRRRLYARIATMPHSTVREELIAVAQRYEIGAH
jgi:hypothetical protein